ncbi:ABC transporter substrate-binding protein [Vibrio sp. vnigr-6D03]|uniref:ABC transporter substrate-binding protein n=1 Tax=Vibrio sp. vnigr-6D03 TaxID=2058088 RepID=UPI000C321890|nr:ABC transporter substrate-binding protein [Vibrio sp. vnigr-6D03]PKF77001.1 ABC transporter substrate-binding protein [Vibrio sp. vnigr-6D03]
MNKWSLKILSFLIFCLLSIGVNANQNELVILTTFSRDPLIPLVEEFKRLNSGVEVKVVHRPTSSSMKLLNNQYIEDIDLVLTSSPLVISRLTMQEKLVDVPTSFKPPLSLSTYILPKPNKVVTIGYSGAGVVWNRDYFNNHELPEPTSFTSLTDPVYFGHVTMSTPSRSGTTQLMVESILTQYGWNKGWQIIANVGANLATISSRSFGVADSVAAGSIGVGPTIDSYAKNLKRKLDYIDFRHDEDLTLMPTYIGFVKQKTEDTYRQRFVELLLSNEIQTAIQTNTFAKYSVNDTKLLHGKHVVLDLDALMEREHGIIHLYDVLITQQLPQLQDAWLAIIQARKRFASSKLALIELDHLQKRLFSPPINQSEFLHSMQEIFSTHESGNTHKPEVRAKLAQWQHTVKTHRESTISNVIQSVRNLVQGAGL